MKDIELDCQVVSDLAPVQDWTIDAEQLLKTLAVDTAQLLESVKKHFLKIGQASRKILNLAEESQEEKQVQRFFKHNFSPELRKDIRKGLNFWDYTQQLDDVEEDIRFVLSNTGFDAGNAIISKLPNTLSKVEFPEVLEDPIAKKIDVAANILTELVETTLKEKEGIDKGVKPSDIGRLIKLHSVPDCDRVEFKEAHTTYRAEVIDYCPETDVVKVKIDGSGEEKEIPRGTIALKEQKAPKLHEPCLIQGDAVDYYNRCGIFKALLADDKALVLLLDGRLIEVPKKQIVKGKKGSPIPELLHLLDESGNTEKVSLAVEKAKEETSKIFQKQIDELTKEAGRAYKDGQEFAAAKMQPNIPLEVFLEIPVEEKVEIFKAQPGETQNLILSNYVKSLPLEKIDRPVVEIKTLVETEPVKVPVVEPVNRLVVRAEAVIKADTTTTGILPDAKPVDLDITRFAPKDLTETLPVEPTLSLEEKLAEAEVEYQKAVDALEAKKKELSVDPVLVTISHTVKKQCEREIKAANNAKTKLYRLRLDLQALSQPTIQEQEPQRVELAFSEKEITKADELLLKGYRAIEDGAKVQAVLKEMSIDFPQLATYLASVSGKEWLCLYYFKNAADAQVIVRSVVPDQKEADAIIDRAIDCSQELDNIAGYYREGNLSALERIDTRLKVIAELLLTKEDIAAIELRICKSKTQVINNEEAKITTRTKDDPATSSYSIETIKEWLCCHQIQNGIAYLETNGIPLTDVLSANELQAMYDGGGQKQINAIVLVDRFKCRNLINFESLAQPSKRMVQNSSSPKVNPKLPKVEPTEVTEEIPGGF
jgi:hypothetical protein